MSELCPAGPGLTVFLTGLPAAGKSALAGALARRLGEAGRRVTLLDGDAIRKRLSPRLGFSKEEREAHARRIGLMAREITRRGGVAICAMIAPYGAVRKEVRLTVEAVGPFLLVYVATPLEVCEARDPKGLYARARAGLLEALTGVSDPYEPPDDADVVVDTSRQSLEEAASLIIDQIQRCATCGTEGPPRRAPSCRDGPPWAPGQRTVPRPR